jgi:hypothetical protein
MQTLTIKDLPLNKEMDANEMTATQGGFTLLNNVVPFNTLLFAPPVPPATPAPGHHGCGYNGGDGGGGLGIDDYGQPPYMPF